MNNINGTSHSLQQIVAQRATYAAGAILYPISALLQLLKIILLLKPLTAIPASLVIYALRKKYGECAQAPKARRHIEHLSSWSLIGNAKDIVILVNQLRKGGHCAYSMVRGCRLNGCQPTIRSIAKSALVMPFRGSYHGRDSIHSFMVSACVRPEENQNGQTPWSTILKEWLWSGTNFCISAE